MKIAMVSHYFSSHRGGVETVAEHLYCELAFRGETVVWMAGNATAEPLNICDSRALAFPVLNWIERKTGIPFPVPTARAVKTIASEIRKADVLILHDSLYLGNIIAFITAKLRHVPVVLIQHTRFSPTRNAFVNAVIRFSSHVISRPMLRFSEQVVFISEATRQAFAAVPLRRPPRIVFNGVGTELFRPPVNDEERLSLRQSFGLPAGQPVMLFVGRFVAVKKLSILRRMAELRPEYVWAFAGWGPLDPCKWEASNVRVFHALEAERVAALYRAADVFVLASTGEGFPLVIQEALASGMSVVCSTETLMADPEMVAVARGVAVLAGDEEQTAREFLVTIDDVLNSEMHPAKSEQRRTFAVSRYSWKRAAEQYLEIVSGLVPRPFSDTISARSKAIL